MIIYLTGQPGAGKTTIGRELCAQLPGTILIDGDELREITKNFDYTPDGRLKNLEAAHSTALFLNHKGFTPIIAMVSPFRLQRNALKLKTTVHEFHIFTQNPTERPRAHFHLDYYEPPTENFTPICTDQPLYKCINDIKTAIIYAKENSPAAIEYSGNGHSR